MFAVAATKFKMVNRNNLIKTVGENICVRSIKKRQRYRINS